MTTTNSFIDKISNEQTAQLPAIEFRGEIRIVDNERDIAAACKRLAEEPVIGFDTETRPSFRPGVTFRVSLLQLSTPEVCYLFRLNKIPLAKPILQLLENAGMAREAHHPVGEVSGGQLQRALLCRALIADPRLLILDEPTNFVDNKFEKALYDMLRELNDRMAIVVVSHDIGTITSVVKEIVCVNRHVHRHRSNILTEEQLRNYDCPIQIVTHGTVPHTVLEHHPGDCCPDHE